MKTSIYLPDDMAQQARERGISLSEVTQNALRGAMPDNAFVSVPAIQEVRGVPSAEPVLQVALTAVAGGLPDGASALFLISGLVQADGGHTVDLGTAEPLFEQLSYGSSEPRKFQLLPRWRLSVTAIERLEQIRAGGNFMFAVGVRYGLLGGAAAPDWREPHRPLRVPFPDQPTQVIVKAHDWVRDVLEPWQVATAVSLTIPLPQGGTTDAHRAIVTRLAEARRQLDSGQWKASIAASREACEMLRAMLPRAIAPKAQDRGADERAAAILDAMAVLAKTLYDYESAASHPDEHLRDIAWSRENAMLALGTAASVAQLVFARN